MARVYGPPMADQPSWRQRFDALEKELSPRLESLVRSEQFAVAVGLAARAQRAAEGTFARTTRRALHRLNLPAGTDMSRILHEIGQLRLQVGELSAELDEARAALVGSPPVVAPIEQRVPANKRSGKRATKATKATKRTRATKTTKKAGAA
jgi:hypothetical protein